MAKIKEQQGVYRAKRDMSESEMISNAKASALHALEKLPGDATYDDIMYELYVLQKIERGQDDVRKRRTVAHKEVKKRLHRWLK
ncbi:MAG TPA: hypothetical protein VLX91_05645 [Candidatus Acidoferrales bacterium]|nr:hypothetical protein [Candidatus Acidoferrales bacterium]